MNYRATKTLPNQSINNGTNDLLTVTNMYDSVDSKEEVVVEEEPTSSVSIPQISRDELLICETIGEGSFASIFRIKLHHDREGSVNEGLLSSPERNSRGVSKESKHSDNNNNEERKLSYQYKQQSSYAVKSLNSKTRSNPKRFEAAAVDLATEADILLQVSSHANIASLRALSKGFWNDPGNGFLVLEYLPDILDRRLMRWRWKYNTSSSSSSYSPTTSYSPSKVLHSPAAAVPIFGGKRDQRVSEQIARTNSVAVGLSKAMAHLHKHKIIHCDLKPANVGFDWNGTVRLFDFGLAQFADSSNDTNDRNGHGERTRGRGLVDWTASPTIGNQRKQRSSSAHTRKCGGRNNNNHSSNNNSSSNNCSSSSKVAGTLRYTAPEIISGHQPHHYSSDVFSMGVLLWEVFTLQRPFELVARQANSTEDYKRLITLRRNRLPVTETALPCPVLRHIIDSCLQTYPDDRPTMSQIVKRLEEEQVQSMQEELKKKRQEKIKRMEKLRRTAVLPFVD